MELEVAVQVGGSDIRAGILYAHARRGVGSASFRCDGDYLADPRSFPLAPDMPLADSATSPPPARAWAGRDRRRRSSTSGAS